MKNTFHKQLYEATQTQHIAVEHVFNFKSGIHTENLHLFLHTMLATRFHYQSILAGLEKRFGLDTHNSYFLELLRKDLGVFESNVAKEINVKELNESANIDISKALGIFYVLAGSSAGAKVILSMVKKSSIDCPLQYFNAMSTSSKNQMAIFHELLDKCDYIDHQVIESAQQTFDFIQNIASNGLKKRDTAI